MWPLIEEKYKIIKILGEGSFGQVCLAIHRASHKKVAIKKIENPFACIYAFKKIVREI